MQAVADLPVERGAIDVLLRPRSIAIIGASERSRWSKALCDNLALGGYTGALHLINRRGGIVHGRQSATSCAALGARVDLGILVVPAEAILDAIDDLATAGARAALVLSSGFAETGAEGVALQAALGARARRHGMRLTGPNSLGLINFVDRIYPWTTPVRAPSQPSGVAIVSQSGATAYFAAELAYQQDLGLSYVIATGNEADLDVSAFVEHLIDDPQTRAIALFIETVRQPQRFLRAAARALQAGKALVVLKVGASEVTAKSAAAHTGALVGDDRVFDGICQQFGIIRVYSVEQLLATASIAARTGVLRAGGIAVVSNSGGMCEIAADSAEKGGVSVPALQDEIAARLREVLPGFGTPHNPLDVTGAVDPPQCREIVRLMASQADIAAVLCIWYALPTCAEEESERLTGVHTALSQGLNEIAIPGLMTSYTNTYVNPHAQAIAARLNAPYLACGLDRSINGLAGVVWWSAQQRRARSGKHGAAGLRMAPGAVQSADQSAHQSAHQSTDNCADNSAAERPMSESAALRYLASQGVPVVPAVLAADAAAAIVAAQKINGPVVLKIASVDIAHKSDIGGVMLNLSGDAAVANAYAQVTGAARDQAPQAQIDGVLVAPMRERGIELIVGLAQDPQWGPVLAVGLGGVWVEVLKDVALRVLPVDAAEIRRMLTGLRGASLLAGQRGVPAADIDAVAAVIEKIANAALRLGPTLTAMDVNPLWVRGDQVEALDALFVWDAPEQSVNQHGRMPHDEPCTMKTRS